ELVYRIVLPTRRQARKRLVRWLERYNRVRRHSHCGYQAPALYEAQTAPTTSNPLARAA
ncbi:MAG: Integrase core domain, partial [Thermoleophilaceae bacterium]|nr:Integrase core domain [Thermoleophilaceae bacterium]